MVLLGDQFLPIVSSFGFIEAPPERAADAFVGWQEPIQMRRAVQIVENQVTGGLTELLERLLPLTSVETTKFLFIATMSRWTAFFDNGYRGTDAFSTLSYLADKLGCRGLRVVSIPEGKAPYPANILEIYGPTRTEFLNYVRSVSASKDGNVWRFSASGDVQPFEEVQAYKARRIKDRFTGEMLSRYLQALDIQAFNPSFYTKRAVLVEKRGGCSDAMREFSLADARKSFCSPF